jgi:hypothetical protein
MSVHQEFKAYLSGRLGHGFLRVRCDTCHFERLVAISCKKRDFSTLSDHRLINSCKASGYWKEIFSYSPHIRLILKFLHPTNP